MLPLQFYSLQVYLRTAQISILSSSQPAAMSLKLSNTIAMENALMNMNQQAMVFIMIAEITMTELRTELHSYLLEGADDEMTIMIDHY